MINYGKNFKKAKDELLVMAGYFLYKNQDEMLKKIIRAYWAFFIFELSSRTEKSLPAFESIRLAREIKKFNEKEVINI